MARTKKVVEEVMNQVAEEVKEVVKEETFQKGIAELEADAKAQEVKYIKCEIMSADVDTTTNIVTLTVQDVAYQSDISFWFHEDFKPTFYKIELDMSKDSQRQLIFDYLITYCFRCRKYKTIIDKIQKGLVGYTWSFSEKMLQKIA